jgi:hypothetical protein
MVPLRLNQCRVIKQDQRRLLRTSSSDSWTAAQRFRGSMFWVQRFKVNITLVLNSVDKCIHFDQIYRSDTGFELNVEHRTPNIERRILRTLRFVDFKIREQ